MVFRPKGLRPAYARAFSSDNAFELEQGLAALMENKRRTDVLIVGQGLAGTALAWQLHQSGRDFLVADAQRDSSASKLAAGLITPVGGKRFTSPPYFENLRDEAVRHYRSVESDLGIRCFQEENAFRFCHSHEEAETFKERREPLRSRGLVTSLDTLSVAGLNTGLSGFKMPTAARLDVKRYLDKSQRFFEQAGRFLSLEINPSNVLVNAIGVTLAECAISSNHIVFCGGYSDARNPWLPKGVFNSAKGELLFISIEDFNVNGPIHAFKRWLVPGDSTGLYTFGATYDHDDVTLTTTATARQELEHDLEQLIRRPYHVISQKAGVRPIGMQRRVIFGQHTEHRQVSWINGLGSKGTLLAPHLAGLMTTALASGTAPRLAYDL